MALLAIAFPVSVLSTRSQYVPSSSHEGELQNVTGAWEYLQNSTNVLVDISVFLRFGNVVSSVVPYPGDTKTHLVVNKAIELGLVKGRDVQ